MRSLRLLVHQIQRLSNNLGRNSSASLARGRGVFDMLNQGVAGSVFTVCQIVFQFADRQRLNPFQQAGLSANALMLSAFRGCLESLSHHISWPPNGLRVRVAHSGSSCHSPFMMNFSGREFDRRCPDLVDAFLDRDGIRLPVRKITRQQDQLCRRLADLKRLDVVCVDVIRHRD